MTPSSLTVARLWRLIAGSELRRNVLETYANRLLVTAVTFATAIAVTRALGPAGRGLFAIATTVGAIGAQFANLGLHASNTYYVAKHPRLLPALVGNTLMAVAAAAAVTALGGVAFVLWPGLAPLHGPLLLLALASIPTGLAYLLFQSLLLGVHEVRAYNRIELGGKLLAFSLLLPLALFGARRVELFFGVTLASVAASVLWTLLRLGGVSRKPPAFSWNIFRRSFRLGIKAYSIAFFGYLLLRIDLLIVQYLLGPAQAGYYSICQVLSENVMMFPIVVGLLLFPKLSATSERAERSRLAFRAVAATAALTLPVVAVAAASAKPLIAIAFGPSFLPAVGPFIWLMPGIYFLGIETVMVQLLNSEGFPPVIVAAWIVAVLVNVVLNLWAIPRYGIVGASAVSSVCYFLMFLIVATVVWKRALNWRTAQAVSAAPDLEPVCE